jgi:hypothetical protein
MKTRNALRTTWRKIAYSYLSASGITFSICYQNIGHSRKNQV